jgi:hypothetical protein
MGWLNYGLGGGPDRLGGICCIDGDRSGLGFAYCRLVVLHFTLLYILLCMRP